MCSLARSPISCRRRLGQPFIVENRPGGGQNIGGRACAEAPPDGYTICVLSTEPVIYNQFQYKSLPFNPEKDFLPIRLLFLNSLALVVNPSLKVKTIPELIAYAKSKPGTLSYGTFSFPFMQFMDKFNKEEGTDIVRVPFKSGGEATTAVLAGTTPVAILALSNMVSLLQSGRITAIAIMGNARSPLLPDVPTLTEVRPRDQYPPPWFGLFAPTGTPQPIVTKLAHEVSRIIDDPGFRKRMFVDRGVEPSEKTTRSVRRLHTGGPQDRRADFPGVGPEADVTRPCALGPDQWLSSRLSNSRARKTDASI